jgi:deoxyhypusine synthase
MATLISFRARRTITQVVEVRMVHVVCRNKAKFGSDFLSCISVPYSCSKLCILGADARQPRVHRTHQLPTTDPHTARVQYIHPRDADRATNAQNMKLIRRAYSSKYQNARKRREKT